MKTESGKLYGRSWLFYPLIMLLFCIAGTFAPCHLFADGCFVKFVWDKHRDINEPTQKAIIAFDAGHEELILQVKYDGPLDEFGWLIPVPSLPTVEKGSMECFYELSKFTQKNFESRGTYGAMSARTKGMDREDPPVKVIEVKTVGAYKIAVLSTKEATALEDWLRDNHFSFPDHAADVIGSYVKQGWYFVAVKINLKGGSLYSTSKELASGELNPLQIRFASGQCVFPLKISSLNHTPSEVQVYVLSPEPLVEKTFFEKDLAANYVWRTNRQAEYVKSLENLQALRTGFAVRAGQIPASWRPTSREPDYQLSRRSEVNIGNLIPYASVGRKEIPVCMEQIVVLKQKRTWWLMKKTWTFQPEEMRDLTFVPAIPVFTAALAEDEGAFAAANLLRSGTNGVSALIAAMQNTNLVVRAHAASVAEEVFSVWPSRAYEPSEERKPRQLSPERLTLLSTLLNDSDPEVRLHAVYAAENSESPLFFNRMLKLLRDDYVEISGGALGYLTYQQDELPKHIPLFRQMLQDTNVNVQIAGLRLLTSIPDVDIPREDLLPLFSVPRMELAGAAVAYLRGKSFTTEESKALLHNSLPMARLMGLKVITTDLSNETIELAMPLLKDPEEIIRTRAHSLLTDLTGQNFPANRPEQWEKWWEQNKATFKVTISQDEFREKRQERLRQRRNTESRLPP